MTLHLRCGEKGNTSALDHTDSIISLRFSSGAPMNDVLDGQVFLLVSHNAVILFAGQISLFRLCKRSLAENHLAVLGYLEPIGPTELGCV